MSLTNTPTYPLLKAEYADLLSSMVIRQDKLPVIDAVVKRIIANKERYCGVEQRTTVPGMWSRSSIASNPAATSTRICITGSLVRAHRP